MEQFEYQIYYLNSSTSTYYRLNQVPSFDISYGMQIGYPVLDSATFSIDGSFITVSYDISTNRGGKVGSGNQEYFPCIEVFSYEDRGELCVWVSSQKLKMDLKPISVVRVNDEIFSRANTIKGSCFSQDEKFYENVMK